MFRFGQLCKNCPGEKKCKDQPSESLPWKIRCVKCEGQMIDEGQIKKDYESSEEIQKMFGDFEAYRKTVVCPECDNTGQMKITECPDRLITPDIWETIEMTEFWESGMPPAAGGVLDQTNIFVCMARIIMAEKRYWKNKLGIMT